MTDLQRNRLNKLVGAARFYQGRSITIEKVIPQDGFVTVKTSGGHFNFEDYEIDGFLAELSTSAMLHEEDAAGQESEGLAGLNVYGSKDAGFQKSAPKSHEPVVQSYMPTAESIELRSILMESIRDVKKGTLDPGRAKLVFEGANAMVNVQKAELYAIGMIKGRRG